MNRAPSPGTGQDLRAVGVFAGYLVFIIVVGAVLSVLVVAGMQAVGGAMAEIVADKGPDRIFRRCMVLAALVALPVLLKVFQWQGRGDFGWTPGQPGRKSVAKEVFMGIALGLAILGFLSVVDLLVGARFINPKSLGLKMFSRVAGYGAAALVIALIEETLCRGMLFRSSARLWGAGWAALGTSLFFALAHFISPAPEVFETPGMLSRMVAVAASSITAMGAVPSIAIRFVNLALLGLVLCAFTRRYGSIWFAVGLHAGCVWVMKFNGYLTDIVRDKPYTFLVGQRSDTTDSLLATLVLLGLLVAAARHRTRITT